jgi:hypothetical protein
VPLLGGAATHPTHGFVSSPCASLRPRLPGRRKRGAVRGWRPFS